MAERRQDVEAQGAEEVDPVCGARLQAGRAGTVRLRLAGRTWSFCGPACRGHFAREAERAAVAEALRAGRLLSHRARARWGVA